MKGGCKTEFVDGVIDEGVRRTRHARDTRAAADDQHAEHVASHPSGISKCHYHLCVMVCRKAKIKASSAKFVSRGGKIESNSPSRIVAIPVDYLQYTLS
jgi:hypothetical protein